ncbi:MAG: type II toxin-antitoxin system PemK/MazF family toxin [bacterium]|nr:type II toxin-antitoxin system PemK/MazF family toxin [bacterium]
MVIPRQGDIWWAEAQDKRRPVLVVTRSEAVPVLNWILVAPITRSIRGIPTEIPLDQESGVEVPCAASFDNLQPIRKTFLTDRIGTLPFPRQGICRTLAAMADC